MLPVPSWGAAGQARKVSTEMVVWGRGVTHPRASLLSVPPPSCPRSRDFYHTCYCLSGLAIAQHFGSGDLHHELVLGIPENRLVGLGGGGGGDRGLPLRGFFRLKVLSPSLWQRPTHPVYNIVPEKVVKAVMHFLQQPVPSLEAAG